jgi:hypothetical protein
MNEQRILDELLELLEAQGVTVRKESLGGRGGGLARVRGQRLFFVDSDADSTETAARCAEAVADLVDIEAVYLRPDVREFIAACAARTDRRGKNLNSDRPA